jgi:hypothetical protein
VSDEAGSHDGSSYGHGVDHAAVDDTDTSASGSRRPRRAVAIVSVALVAVLVVVAVGVGIGAVVRGGSSTTGAAAEEATRLLDESLKAAHHARTFHYQSTSTTAGVEQLTIGDAAPDRGSQAITIGSHIIDIVVVGTEAFFKGDATVLQSQLGLDPRTAEQHADQWISLQPSDAPYQSVYTAVNTSSALADGITITPKRVLSAGHVDGVAVTSISGAIPPTDQTPESGTAQLDVSVSSHLPVRFSSAGVVSGKRTMVRVDFGAWGERVPVDAPTGALPYSSLQIGAIPPEPGNPPILT